MRRTTAILLAIVMLVALAACGNDEKTQSTDDATSVEASLETSEKAEETSESSNAASSAEVISESSENASLAESTAEVSDETSETPSRPDSSVADSSTTDSSTTDSSTPDSSIPDSSVADSSLADSSIPDSSTTDSSVPDSSATDSSEPEIVGGWSYSFDDAVQKRNFAKITNTVPEPIDSYTVRSVSENEVVFEFADANGVENFKQMIQILSDFLYQGQEGSIIYYENATHYINLNGNVITVTLK